MRIQKETKWLCENAKMLEKFSGQWVLFNSFKGVVSTSPSFEKVIKSKRMKGVSNPFVFHVPSKDELKTPWPGFQK